MIWLAQYFTLRQRTCLPHRTQLQWYTRPQSSIPKSSLIFHMKISYSHGRILGRDMVLIHIWKTKGIIWEKQEVSFVFCKTDFTRTIWPLLISCNQAAISCFYQACYHGASACLAIQWWLMLLRQWIQFIPRLSINQVSVQIYMKGPYQSLKTIHSYSLYLRRKYEKMRSKMTGVLIANGATYY